MIPTRACGTMRTVRTPSASTRITMTMIAMTTGSIFLSSPVLADGALHLELDQAVELEGVLERQLLGDGLDEAPHDHRGGLHLVQAAAHQVEELILAHLAHRGLMGRGDLAVLLDLDVRVSVGARVLIEQQRIAAHGALGAD